MNLKWRITLVTALLIAVASSLIGAASYFSISQAQLNAIDTNLQNAVGIAPGRAFERQMARGREFSNFYTPIGIALVSGNSEVSVIRPAGTAESPEIFPSVPISNINADSSTELTFTDPESGVEYRAIARPAGRNMQVIAVTSLDSYSQTMRQILLSIISFVLGVTLLGALFSWFVVRRFFTPVDSMISAASEISHGNTSLLVPDAAPGTELGELSEALNSMVLALRQSIITTQDSETALRNFVSDASHEIRTPLTVIRGYSEILLAQSGTTESERRAVERIDAESKRLERLITSLLELDRHSHEQSGNRVVHLHELVSAHVQDLLAMSPRPATLSIDPVSIMGDPDSWEQLLGNITQNIMRYTPTGSPIEVQLHPLTYAGGNYAELIVGDSGPGIPTDMRERIFERFARLDDSRSTETGGFGLGMSIIKATVIAHSGTIALEESQAGGLRIRIRVPAN